MYDPILSATVSFVVIAAALFPLYLNLKRRYVLTAVQPADNFPVQEPFSVIRGNAAAATPLVHPTLLPVAREEEDEIIAWSDFTDEDVIEWLPEAESALLAEAESAIGRIQEVLNHIASSPANPEEVTSKISAIVTSYVILQDTEYYDSINHYISVAVRRDADITLSGEEIQALWAA